VPPSTPTELDKLNPELVGAVGVTFTALDEIPVPAEFEAATEHE
jgi:hypothetical protein